MKPGIDYIGISTPFYCIDGKGQLLLHKRSKICRDEHGRWDPGGGQLEKGLTPEQNVLKEVAEEYGCVGKIVGQIPAHSIFRQWDRKKTHWMVLPFFILVDPQNVKINEPEKIDEIGWFSVKNLPTPLHSGFTYTFKHFQSYFQKYL